MEKISTNHLILAARRCEAVLHSESPKSWQIAIRETYGDKINFLKTFNPGLQAKFMTALDRCFTGTAPSLTRVKKTYGEETAESWLMVQITDLAEFSSIKEKPEPEHIETLAQVILANFSFLKVTELMVFFQKFKSGEYGKFYGVIDNLVITEALHKFVEFRSKVLERAERDRIAAEREVVWKDMEENGITCEEYLQRKQARR